MRATSNYSVRPCQHWGYWKRGNGKRETEVTLDWTLDTNSTFNKNIWHILPVPLSLKLSIRQFAINVVIMSYSLKNNNTNNYIFTVFALQINSRASVTPHNFPGSYSATSITNWATQQNWLDCFFGFVSFNDCHFFIPTFFQSRVFQCRVFYCRAISVPSTLNIAFIWTSRN